MKVNTLLYLQIREKMPRKLHPSSKINCQVITSIKEREQSIDGEAAIFTSHRWNCTVGVGRNGTHFS